MLTHHGRISKRSLSSAETDDASATGSECRNSKAEARLTNERLIFRNSLCNITHKPQTTLTITVKFIFYICLTIKCDLTAICGKIKLKSKILHFRIY